MTGKLLKNRGIKSMKMSTVNGWKNLNENIFRTTSHITFHQHNEQYQHAPTQQTHVMENTNKIFANKTLELKNIKFFGFDMDYTLAEYHSPALENLGLEFLLKRLMEMGYPKELSNIKYDPTFPIRGVWVDKKLGNLLKTDYHGNILIAYHGLTKMTDEEISRIYQDKFINLTDSRIMVANTHYNLPELFLIAATISHFESIEGCEKHGTHLVLPNNLTIDYSTIVKDIRSAMDHVHCGNEMGNIILNNLDKYVKKSSNLPKMLKHLKSNGAKVFLLTNSNYEYTKMILKYILNCSDNNENEWKSYFDYIVTTACKPNFFLKSSPLNQIDEDTRLVSTVKHVGPLESGKVYSGGNVREFSNSIGANGTDVLYFGDHIYGDVLKSKKTSGWKTCFIVPEIEQEVECKQIKDKLISKLEWLYDQLANAQNIYYPISQAINIKIIEDEIKKTTEKIDDLHGKFGSLFIYGNKRTFFAEQASRYADIYTASCLNIFEYSTHHMFRSTFSYMSHEQ